MPTYGVRSILKWSRRTNQRKKHLYEERVTLWTAESLEDALDLAEQEANGYASDCNAKRCGLLQGYWMLEDLKLKSQGIEVFSLLRESDLPPKTYLKVFFDTGHEFQGEYGLDRKSPRRRPQKIRKRTRRSH
jgi:hypothetical protein